jgi:amino acid transporter
MSAQNNKIKKQMGLWAATSIGVGAMIGAGLFALIGIAVEITGEYAYLAFIIAGTTALLTSYSVSKLAVKLPSKGGAVEYINYAYGKGIFSGSVNIVMWIGYIIVTSLYARAFGEYSRVLFDLSANSSLVYLFISSIIVIFVIINFISANVVGKSEFLIVSIKLIILLLFGIVGLFNIESDRVVTTSGIDLTNLFLASGVLFMSYEGFGLVANTAEDIKNPAENLPKALFLSVLIVIIIYTLVSVVVIGNLPTQSIINAKEYALAEAAKPFMGRYGFTLMGIAALFSTASAINATIYGPVNMINVTAESGQVPPIFARRLFGHKSGMALIITSVIIVLISLLLNLEAIAETGSLIFLLVYSIVNTSNYKLRKFTSSNIILVVLSILSTTISFFILFYFLIIEENLSTYFFIAILGSVFLFEWFYKNIISKNK